MSNFKRWTLIYVATSVTMVVVLAIIWRFVIGASVETVAIATAACVLGAATTIVWRYRNTRNQSG